jgi:hypothetical protein
MTAVCIGQQESARTKVQASPTRDKNHVGIKQQTRMVRLLESTPGRTAHKTQKSFYF